MAFSGTFKVTSRDNLDNFLTAMGASAEEAASVKGMTLVQKITQDNNNFIVEKVLPKKTVTNKFTIGQPATITNIRGKEIEATMKLEGGKLIAEKGPFKQVSEIEGNELVETITFNNVTMKRRSARQ